jgi:H+-transporting ATPase
MPGIDRARVLALAALASSEADQDPIDSAVRAAAAGLREPIPAEHVVRFVPFDPATKTAEAFLLDRDGGEIRVVKGAFEILSNLVEAPPDARRMVNDMAGQGHRVIAVAMGNSGAMRLVGLIALSDPPRDDSARLIGDLRDLGVRTVMVTGDSPVTAASIAGKVGIAGGVCPPARIADDISTDQYGVFARIVPEEKFRLVKALQSRGHVVGMCGDGTNDAPALRQAQIGIAVSSATDVAKAAAGMVMTEPGLAGIVFAVREGRVGFQRLLTYTLNMLVKKTEIVLFLAIGLVLTGDAIMTPPLMVLMLMTNDFLAMSLTTDRASFASSPSVWRMRNFAFAAVLLGACKLAFSTAVLAVGTFHFALGPGALQTLAFVTLVFGSQALLYVIRERRPMWRSRPGAWVLAASAADIAIVSVLALSGTLMAPLPWRALVAVFVAAAGFALILDLIKLRLMQLFKMN